jgi:hypothetical protein
MLSVFTDTSDGNRQPATAETNGAHMRKYFLFISCFGSLLFASLASAAPHPGATSALVTPKLGVFRSPFGFKLDSGGTGWQQAAAPNDNRYIATVYKSPKKNAKGEAPMLTVRVDALKKDVPLEKYIERWTKEYPKFGFDVLGSQPFMQNKEKGHVLDLINRDNGRQLRQVVFMKKQKAVILTCRDHSDRFSDTLKDCNQIIRTFNWSE